MKFISVAALLASLGAVTAASFVGCSSQDKTTLVAAPEQSSRGSLQLSLDASGHSFSTVTAVLSGPGLDTQTHEIDVSDPNAVVSLFFGGLPPGAGYSIQLIAGDCRGQSTFDVRPGEVSSVNVVLSCSAPVASDAGVGGVEITGTFGGGSSTGACNPIADLLAAPSAQNGSAPSKISLVLRDGATAAAIAWSSASASGASGVIGDMSGEADSEVTFDCTADGKAYVIATVTAATDAGVCIEQGRISISCSNQTSPAPVCGDGIINQDSEQCDGSALPADAGPTGTTCSSTCTLLPPAAPACGDGIINQDSEQCDGSALPADAGPPGTTCSSTCTLLPPAAPVCGDGIINQDSEQCDGAALPANAAAGTGCDASCKLVVALPPLCGDGKINQQAEQCDGTALPPDAPPGSTCRGDCTLAPPVQLGDCGKCAAESCSAQLADVNASPSTSLLLDCVLGPDWRQGSPAPADACGNGLLMSCYCGSADSGTCAIAPPASLDGSCRDLLLAGTGCSDSACVASNFVSSGTVAGKAMLFAQCEQAFCYDSCFSSD